MKKLIAITLCAIMAFSFTACSNNKPPQENSQAPSSGDEIANPWVECKTIAEAEKNVGFTLYAPGIVPDGYKQEAIRTMEKSLFEIIYINGENELRFRQGKDNEDIGNISADYNEYKESNTMTVGSLQVTTKGNDGKVNLATWTDGGYAFAILADGLDNTAISDMIDSMQAEANEQIPNPYVECKTIAEAEKIAGFTMALPEKTPEGYVQGLIQAIQDEMIQVDYKNGEKEMQVRKAKGNSDISGDYNEYAEKNTLTVGSLQVSIRGNNGKVNVATWVDGAFSYSISGVDFDTTAISDMVSGTR